MTLYSPNPEGIPTCKTYKIYRKSLATVNFCLNWRVGPGLRDVCPDAPRWEGACRSVGLGGQNGLHPLIAPLIAPLVAPGYALEV
jgi:hypothetical protein